MPVKALISPGYRYRLGLISLICLCWAGWSTYDGLVTYPQQRERAQLFQQYQEEGRAVDWAILANENGWDENPGEPKSELDILTQFIMAGIAGPIGLIFAFNFIATAGRWVQIDADTLSVSNGRSVTLDNIATLDKARWDNKGIAVVNYDDQGKPRRIVLDDWKFDRTATETILRQVEDGIPRDKIINGDPEPPLESPEDQGGEQVNELDQDQDQRAAHIHPVDDGAKLGPTESPSDQDTQAQSKPA